MENNTSKRPRKTHKRKKEQRGSGVVGLAASVLAHVAIEVIGKSIMTKKPVIKVLADTTFK